LVAYNKTNARKSATTTKIKEKLFLNVFWAVAHVLSNTGRWRRTVHIVTRQDDKTMHCSVDEDSWRICTAEWLACDNVTAWCFGSRDVARTWTTHVRHPDYIVVFVALRPVSWSQHRVTCDYNVPSRSMKTSIYWTRAASEANWIFCREKKTIMRR